MMQRRAFITGITGQDGSYLAELLLDQGWQVHGLIRPATAEIRIAHLRGRVTLHSGNLLDQRSLVQALRASRPDEIYNLAALTVPALTWAEPALTGELTGVGVTRLLEAMRETCPDARFCQASSSAIFGRSHEAPQNELTPVQPRSPYGAAKAYGHHMTINYRESFGLHASSAILFNHESEHRQREFVTRKITWHAAAIRLGLCDELRLGNLDAERDWGYAKDFMEAMWLMVQQDRPGDYVIATGESRRVRDWLDIAFGRLGLDWEPYVSVDDELRRLPDLDSLVGETSKARRVLGWRPRTSFEGMVGRMVDADLRRLGGG